MIVEVFSDPICPWCYIGKRRLERALARDNRGGDVSLRWRAFQLNPNMPEAGMARDAYVARKFGGEAQAREIYDAIASVGESEGIEFAFERITHTPNTVMSHRLIRLAARHGKADAIVEALFRAFLLDGDNIGDRDTLVALAAGCGLDGDSVGDFLASSLDEAEVRAEHDYAVSQEITGVPCFIIDGRYALVGAQEPDAFMPLFQAAEEEHRRSKEAG